MPNEKIYTPTEKQRNDSFDALMYSHLFNGARVQTPFEIVVGSVVRLKTGGPEMTVIDVDEDDVVTSIFFNEDNELHEMELPSECLAVKVHVL